jgi:hypothetical protein
MKAPGTPGEGERPSEGSWRFEPVPGQRSVVRQPRGIATERGPGQGRHRPGLWPVLIMLAFLILLGTLWGSARSPTTDTIGAERAFMVKLLPDFFGAYLGLVNPASTRSADEKCAGLDGLYQKWGSYVAPSGRTGRLLSEWMSAVESSEWDYEFALLPRTAGLQSIRSGGPRPIGNPAELPVTVVALAKELGLSRLVDKVVSTMAPWATTTTTTVGSLAPSA